MDIDKIYTSIIERLKKGERVHLKLEPPLISEIAKILTTSHQGELTKPLCLLAYSARPHLELEKPILKVLNSPLSPSNYIYTVQVAQKHIIDAYQIKGRRLPQEFLEILRNKLSLSSSIEEKKWTVRLIEQCGPQAKSLKKELLQVREEIPALKKIFNRKSRELFLEIQNLLEKV